MVLQASVTADIMKQSERRFLGISLGETRILMRVPGQIQFVVPLDRVDEKDVSYDTVAKKLVLRVPRPIPDRDIVGVDPSRITVWHKVGWCRLSGSARQLEDNANGEVISHLIAAADNEWLQRRAEEETQSAVSQLLAPMCRRLDENVTIHTRYVGEAQVR